MTDADASRLQEFRTCEFCGCRTNAHVRACCDKGRSADSRPMILPAVPPEVMKLPAVADTDSIEWKRFYTRGQIERYAQEAVVADRMQDTLRAGIRNMTAVLKSGEWANLLTTDPDLAALEEQIRKLVEKK